MVDVSPEDLAVVPRWANFHLASAVRAVLTISTQRADLRIMPFLLVPGQPIEFTWEFTWNAKQQSPTPTIDMRLLWGSHQLWEKTNVTLSFKSGVGYRATSTETANVLSPVRDQFYKLGHRKLTLEVQWKGKDWDGTTSGTAKAYDYLDVVSDGAVDAWWQWTTPTWMLADWNSTYALEGNLTNKHKHASAPSVKTSLWEREQGQQASHLVTTKTTSLAVSATEFVKFGSLKQDWSWLNESTWIPTGPLSKTFEYQIGIDVSDEFSNTYSALVAQRSTVHVAIPDSKRQLAAAAASAAVSAAALALAGAAALAGLITAPGAPALFAAAAASYATATKLGNDALDPPEPDPEFARDVDVPTIPFDPEDSGFGQELRAVRRFLRTSLEIVQLNDARSRAVAKILGAGEAGDRAAKTEQHASYNEIMNQLMSRLDDLQKLAPAADSELQQLFQELHRTLAKQEAELPDPLVPADFQGRELVPTELLGGVARLLASRDLEDLVEQRGVSFESTARSLALAIPALEEDDRRAFGEASAGGGHITRLFRQREGSEVWHWCRNCSNWPKTRYKERNEKPRAGERCNECRSKERHDDCTT